MRARVGEPLHVREDPDDHGLAPAAYVPLLAVDRRREPPAGEARGIVAGEDAVEIFVDQRPDERHGLLRRRYVGLLDLAPLEVHARERGIATQHDPTGLGEVHDERLMSGRVSRCRHDLEAGRDAGAAGDR
jgi:hypothetical protein